MQNQMLMILERLGHLERRMNSLYEQLGLVDAPPSGPPPASERVRQLAEEGKKMAAIKQYQQDTGAGLTESVKAVEALGGG